MFHQIPQPCEVRELTGPAAWFAWDTAVAQLDAQPFEQFSLVPVEQQQTQRSIARAEVAA